MIGGIIRELWDMHDGEDAANKTPQAKQINGLFDSLLGQMLDISAYVRTRVMVVLVRLCVGMGHTKFPQQQLTMTRSRLTKARNGHLSGPNDGVRSPSLGCWHSRNISRWPTASTHSSM